MFEQKVQEYVNNLTNKIIKTVEVNNKQDAITSLILTGSLGRDEGTFHVDPETKEVVLDSDVELALIYKNGKKEEAEKIKNILIEQFEEEMNPMTISESRVKNAYNFNHSFKSPKYSSIFMYDLYHGSKTIWGFDYLLLNHDCKYDKYEAKRIVANRIGELICVQQENKENITRQWRGKLVLAVGSAYCIIKNGYKSRYESQLKFIMSQKDDLNNLLGHNFIEDYNNTFLFLRKGGSAYDVPTERLVEYVDKIKRLFYKEEIGHPKINSFSRKMKYAIACIKSKSGLSPLTCEEQIIDALIDEFIEQKESIIQTSKSWKNILY